jgi:hypothetical protein
MEKNTLMKVIAESGYNVGFGAKKHFATYDIVEKAPGWIGLISIAVGIFALVFDQLAGKGISATLAVMGVAGIYISLYSDQKDDYNRIGGELTQSFNNLKTLYYQVKTSQKNDFTDELTRLKEIESDFYKKNLSKQIFLSDWYAHYKFFWQHQIEWIEEGRGFSFWRDKIPLSAYLFMTILFCIAISWTATHIYEFFNLPSCR